MSELSDAVRAALGEEWKTTRQIREETGAGCRTIYHVLTMEEKYGLAERRVVRVSGSARLCEWRRVARWGGPDISPPWRRSFPPWEAAT